MRAGRIQNAAALAGPQLSTKQGGRESGTSEARKQTSSRRCKLVISCQRRHLNVLGARRQREVLQFADLAGCWRWTRQVVPYVRNYTQPTFPVQVFSLAAQARYRRWPALMPHRAFQARKIAFPGIAPFSTTCLLTRVSTSLCGLSFWRVPRFLVGLKGNQQDTTIFGVHKKRHTHMAVSLMDVRKGKYRVDGQIFGSRPARGDRMESRP